MAFRAWIVPSICRCSSVSCPTCCVACVPGCAAPAARALVAGGAGAGSVAVRWPSGARRRRRAGLRCPAHARPAREERGRCEHEWCDASRHRIPSVRQNWCSSRTADHSVHARSRAGDGRGPGATRARRRSSGSRPVARWSDRVARGRLRPGERAIGGRGAAPRGTATARRGEGVPHRLGGAAVVRSTFIAERDHRARRRRASPAGSRCSSSSRGCRTARRTARRRGAAPPRRRPAR